MRSELITCLTLCAEGPSDLLLSRRAGLSLLTFGMHACEKNWEVRLPRIRGRYKFVLVANLRGLAKSGLGSLQPWSCCERKLFVKYLLLSHPVQFSWSSRVSQTIRALELASFDQGLNHITSVLWEMNIEAFPSICSARSSIDGALYKPIC
jgi:hypothetical protein